MSLKLSVNATVSVLFGKKNQKLAVGHVFCITYYEWIFSTDTPTLNHIFYLFYETFDMQTNDFFYWSSYNCMQENLKCLILEYYHLHFIVIFAEVSLSISNKYGECCNEIASLSKRLLLDISCSDLFVVVAVNLQST